MRVVVADADSKFRSSVAKLLRAVGHVVDDAADGEALAVGADVAVVEFDLQCIDALEWVTRARGAGRTTAVLLVSPHDDDSLVRIAFGIGARGLLLRSRLLDDVVAAVEAVGVGDSFVTGSVSGDEDLRQLSTTEARVLILLGDGLTSAEVGLRLGFRTRTVQSYRASIGRKLGLGRAPTVIAFAVAHRARLKRFLRHG